MKISECMVSDFTPETSPMYNTLVSHNCFFFDEQVSIRQTASEI